MSPEQQTVVETVAARWQDAPGALLPVLHAIQSELSFIPPDAVPFLASNLKLSQAEVQGVISFYHDFRTEPPTGPTLRICRGESCRAMGASALETRMQNRLAREGIGECVTLEPVHCLGLCACSPAIALGEEMHGRVSPERLDQLVDECRQAK